MSNMSSGDKKVLSYGDVVLRRSDLELLRGHDFLNDRLIEFFFAYLTSTTAQRQNQIILVPPAVTFWILHCPDADTLSSTVQSLRLSDYEVVMFAVNDNDDVDVAGGGQHWSLLVYYRKQNRFEHYDSMGGMNVKEAKKLASTIQNYLSSQSPTFQEAWTPLQKNGYDCGLYAIAIAEVLCEAHANARVEPSERKQILEEKVTSEEISQKRKTLLNLITTLAEGQNRL